MAIFNGDGKQATLRFAGYHEGIFFWDIYLFGDCPTTYVGQIAYEPSIGRLIPIKIPYGISEVNLKSEVKRILAELYPHQYSELLNSYL